MALLGFLHLRLKIRTDRMIFANSPINQVQIEKRGNIFSVYLSAEVHLAWNFIWNCPHIYFEASVSRELCVRMKMRRHIYLWWDQYRNVSKQQQKYPLDLHFTQTATWRILTLLKNTDTVRFFTLPRVIFYLFLLSVIWGANLPLYWGWHSTTPMFTWEPGRLPWRRSAPLNWCTQE